MAKSTVTTVEFDEATLKSLAAALAPYLTTAPSKSTKGKQEVEPDEDEESEEEGPTYEERAAELGKKRLPSIKKIAIEAGFPEDEVNEAETGDKQMLIDSILADEFPDHEGDDEEEDEEEADEEEEEGDEEEADDEEAVDYSEYSLPELKTACAEIGYAKTDLKGWDRDDLIGLLTEDSGESEDEEDEGEEEEEAEEESEEEGWYTKADLDPMSITELKDLAKEYKIKIPSPVKKATLIKKIVDFGG